MNNIEPCNQIQLFGLNNYFNEFVQLNKNGNLPNKILLSGQKGIGKSTLAYHLINYILSKDENFKYDLSEFKINNANHTYKTIINKSNPNFYLIDIIAEKKYIDINQIRVLISNLNKSSFNQKPRFVLIDNIELLNINSINALLKILEEPTSNVHFMLINNNKKTLPTLTSRCINFKITISHQKSHEIADKLLDGKLYKKINKDLMNYYITPGNIYNLVKFADMNNYDLTKLDLKDFLKIIIKDNHYNKENIFKNLIVEFIQFYFRKFDLASLPNTHDKYYYFMKKIFITKKFNLDEESLFMEFEKDILNG